MSDLLGDGLPAIRVKRIYPGAQLPEYATDGAACIDLRAYTVDGYRQSGSICHAGHPVIVGTGLSVAFPHGWALLIFSRSGHGFRHDVRLANAVAVIDADYRGEIMVKLTCDSQDEEAPPFLVEPGDRIAQAMLIPAPRIQMVEVDELPQTNRGIRGLGSTGTR